MNLKKSSFLADFKKLLALNSVYSYASDIICILYANDKLIQKKYYISYIGDMI